MPNRPTRTLFIACFLCAAALLPGEMVAAADEAPAATQQTLADRLPAFQDVVRATAAQLASLPAQGDPLTLFKDVIGSRLGLNDAAMTVGAKGLTQAMTKELLIEELKPSAAELVRGLAAWQVALAARDLNSSAPAEQLDRFQQQIDAQMAWLTQGTTLEPSLRQLMALSKELRPQGPAAGSTGETTPVTDAIVRLAGATAEIEAWAVQTVHREWFRLFNWKDTVRQRRGLVRLCGTWQWSIHNHQNHREEKTAVIFAPPGAVSSTSPAEIIVLGDSVYLRWETRAGVQEDSLLFSAEGQRLEGTFVNTAGGWGSITGKRTASCFPGKGEKPATGARRHH